MADKDMADNIILTNNDIDELLDELGEEAADAAVDPRSPQHAKEVTLLERPDGRFVEDGKLIAYLGGLHTAEEIAEFERYAGRVLSMESLPRVVPLDLEKGPPIHYRRRVYGPHDHLPASVLRSAGKIYTFRSAMHRGQTKLCAIELEAIGRALGRCSGLKYVVYPGAAPGEHIAFLAEAYPGLEFHLYDPAEFRVHHRFSAFPDSRDRIFINNCLFTDEIAEKWAARGADTILISDIRSGDHSQEEFELEVWKNMQMQQDWWKTINPAAALFKFRLPYTDGEEDSCCPYLDGEILIQPYGPNTSTEGRLLIWAGAGVRVYSSLKYEDFYFWLNNVIREWASFDHGLDLKLVDGLCRCFDCARVVQIFREYAAAFPAPPELFGDVDTYVAYLIGRMVTATGQRFYNPPHGDLVDALPAEKRLALAEKHGRTYVRRRRQKIRDQKKKVQHAPPHVQPHVRPPPSAAPKSREPRQMGSLPRAAQPRGGTKALSIPAISLSLPPPEHFANAGRAARTSAEKTKKGNGGDAGNTTLYQ